MDELLRQDAADLAEDARRLLLELDRDVPGRPRRAASAARRSTSSRRRDASRSWSTCRASPPTRSAWRFAATRVLVVGAKLAAASRAGARFHLAERSYGRFARAVRAGRRGRRDAARARSSTAASCASRCRASTIGAARVIDDSGGARVTTVCSSSATSSASPGRELVRRGLPALVAHHEIDLVIANVENAAAGFGVTPDIADDFLEYGVHVMTGGNHTWDKKEILPYFADQPRLLRPANLPGRRAGPRPLRRASRQRRAGRRHQRHGPRVHDGDRRSVPRRARRDRGRPQGSARSSSSTFTPRPRRRRSRWAGISTAASRPSSARTRTCRRPTSACCRRARPTSPTSA